MVVGCAMVIWTRAHKKMEGRGETECRNMQAGSVKPTWMCQRGPPSGDRRLYSVPRRGCEDDVDDADVE